MPARIPVIDETDPRFVRVLLKTGAQFAPSTDAFSPTRARYSPDLDYFMFLY
jgi:hypothetical protein